MKIKLGKEKSIKLLGSYTESERTKLLKELTTGHDIKFRSLSTTLGYSEAKLKKMTTAMFTLGWISRVK